MLGKTRLGKAQNTTLSEVSTSRVSNCTDFGPSSPSGGWENAPSPRSPMSIARAGMKPATPMERIWDPEGTSHKRTVPSLDADRIFRPRETIAVDVMARACPLKVRRGLIHAAVGPVALEGTTGGSAERIDIEKSTPAVSRTRDEGKNLSDVIALRCALLAVQASGLDCTLGTMYTVPSSYPTANCEPSGATSRAAILRR